jgi:hypothetical protein
MLSVQLDRCRFGLGELIFSPNLTTPSDIMDFLDKQAKCLVDIAKLQTVNPRTKLANNKACK